MVAHAPSTLAMKITEAHILETDNILIELFTLEDKSLIGDFCGTITTINNLETHLPSLSQKTIYLCGDLSQVNYYNLNAAKRVFVIKELSHSYDGKMWKLVHLGQVPLLIQGVGVYYRRFFDLGSDCFNRIVTEHTFQTLTESTKPGKAHRTGIYLTPIKQDGEDLHFHLLRCSKIGRAHV